MRQTLAATAVCTPSIVHPSIHGTDYQVASGPAGTQAGVDNVILLAMPYSADITCLKHDAVAANINNDDALYFHLK